MERDGQAEHVLPERGCEVALEQVAVCDRLAEHAAAEPEVLQVVRVHSRLRVGLVHDAVFGQLEEAVVGVEAGGEVVCACEWERRGEGVKWKLRS